MTGALRQSSQRPVRKNSLRRLNWSQERRCGRVSQNSPEVHRLYADGAIPHALEPGLLCLLPRRRALPPPPAPSAAPRPGRTLLARARPPRRGQRLAAEERPRGVEEAPGGGHLCLASSGYMKEFRRLFRDCCLRWWGGCVVVRTGVGFGCVGGSDDGSFGKLVEWSLSVFVSPGVSTVPGCLA